MFTNVSLHYLCEALFANSINPSSLFDYVLTYVWGKEGVRKEITFELNKDNMVYM